MKNYLLIILITIGVNVSLEAQVMPSPDATSSIKNINVPVNLYTGVASVDVPLYTVPSHGQGQVPISLQYNTGGIKVNEIAGVAGLGWHFNAGGSITRVMRDNPDELAEYKGVHYSNLLDGEDYDREKDLFYFSYPGGGGKFIFSGNIYNQININIRCDQEGYDACAANCDPMSPPSCLDNCNTSYPLQTAYTCPSWHTSAINVIPKSDIRVEFYTDGDLSSYWIIYDMVGNQYIYGLKSGDRETTVSNGKTDNESYDPANELEFVSTWHLSKIFYANQATSTAIEFEYTNATVEDEQISEEIRLDLNTGGNLYSLNGEVKTRYFKTIIETKYLSKITFPKGGVDFNYELRSDLSNGQALKYIRVRDHNAALVTEIELMNDYFISNDYFLQGGVGNCSTEKCRRLKLNAIKVDGQTIRQFDYANDKTFHASGYDYYELPPRDSYYYDHWGYYNGLLSGTTYVSHSENSYPALSGMNRSPGLQSIANILTKVIYPTGGYTEFTYGINTKNGGVRINRIKNFDENDVVIQDTEYKYESQYENDADEPVYIKDVVVDFESVSPYVPITAPYTFTRPVSSIFELNGPETGYQLMEVHNKINGNYTAHYFINGLDYSSTPAKKYRYWVDAAYNNGNKDTSYPDNYEDIAPFTTHTWDHFSRGLENKKISYDENGIKVSEVINNYVQSNYLDSITNNSVVFDSEYYPNEGQAPYHIFFFVSEYQIKNRYIWLDNSITRSFDELGNEIAETTTSYNYHPTYQTLPKEITTTRTDNSGGEAFDSKQLVYYPSDQNDLSFIYSTSTLDDMVHRNMIGVPVQTETQVKLPGYADFKTSSVSNTTFRHQHFAPQPYEARVLNLEEPSDSWGISDFKLVSTQSYNSSGLLESQVGSDEVTTSYVYDAQDYLTSKTITPGGTLPARTTTYTYEPLVGIKTVTDPNGRTVTNEYDSRNRLLLVKDQDDNIVKRYRYNLASEEHELNATIVSTGSQTNVPITFEATNVTAYGGLSDEMFTWDFDGVIKTGQEVTHTYTTHGFHLLSLTITHPEYADPVEILGGATTYGTIWEQDPMGGPSAFCVYDAPGMVSFTTIEYDPGDCLTGDIYYSWEYRTTPSGIWNQFAYGIDLLNGDFTTLETVEEYEIKVTATNPCDATQFYKTKLFSVINTGTNCDPPGQE